METKSILSQQALSKRHWDAFGRDSQVQKDRDYYLRPKDGRLVALDVQSKEPTASIKGHVTWQRVPITTNASVLTRILFWIWSSSNSLTTTLKYLAGCLMMLFLFLLPIGIGGKSRHNGFYDPVRDRDRFYSGSSRNRVEDDPELHLAKAKKRWGNRSAEDLEALLNNFQTLDQDPLNDVGRLDDQYSGLASRPLRPRRLCFLTAGTRDIEDPESCFNVAFGEGTAQYVFVSYTRRQFRVQHVDIEKELQDRIQKEQNKSGRPISDYELAGMRASIELENRQTTRDRTALLRFGIKAARDAGVDAFWIDFKCVAGDHANTDSDATPDEKSQEISEDVYRICDILRSAHSMVVVTGPPHNDKPQGLLAPNYALWRQIWASRLWVLPELLLCPRDHDINIYVETHDTRPEDVIPQVVPKRNLVAQSCSDAEDVRQLMDHFEGTVQLSRIELIRLALDCLARRSTVQWTNADLAYALKGLVARRPEWVEGESGFQAFASLSLANDNQRLLERVICLLPVDPEAEWYDMRDGWRMKLWDIEPSCQIAGVVDDRRVLIDGAYGASIQWNRLEVVPFMKRKTPALLTIYGIVRTAPLLLISAIILLAQGVTLDSAMSRYSYSSTNPLTSAGLVFMVLAGLVILLAPWILRQTHLGKFWDTQAWFFGIEGDVKLGDIEARLFGFNRGRLKWSPNGSLLSNHHLNKETQECEADPPDQENVRDVERKLLNKLRGKGDFAGDSAATSRAVTPVGANGQLGPAVPLLPVAASKTSQRKFTLIDTFTMTATSFYASRPPTTVFICGQEGGMQRAVLCSYDWQTHTYCRETILRMKTRVLERMFRADRFRFAFKR